MTMAIEFGECHKSCCDAMEWRESLGPTATQADAYRVCERADWLVWQLTREPEVWARVRDAVIPLVTAMADRAEAAVAVAWAAAQAAVAVAVDRSPEWHAEWCTKIRAAVPEWPEVPR